LIDNIVDNDNGLIDNIVDNDKSLMVNNDNSLR
jgi:hypothetical protein